MGSFSSCYTFGLKSVALAAHGDCATTLVSDDRTYVGCGRWPAAAASVLASTRRPDSRAVVATAHVVLPAVHCISLEGHSMSAYF